MNYCLQILDFMDLTIETRPKTLLLVKQNRSFCPDLIFCFEGLSIDIFSTILLVLNCSQVYNKTRKFLSAFDHYRPLNHLCTRWSKMIWYLKNVLLLLLSNLFERFVHLEALHIIDIDQPFSTFSILKC